MNLLCIYFPKSPGFIAPVQNSGPDMKKRVLIIVSLALISTFALICAWPSIYLHLFDAYIVIDGIERFHPARSSTGICSYLTVREELNQGYSYVFFINKYPWSKSFFHYEDNAHGGFYHEVALLSLTYDPDHYSQAFEDVSSQPGFSDKIAFRYGSIDFRLNDTERIENERTNSIVHTNYELNGEAPYLDWINLVGWSESKNTLIFLGFNHTVERRTGFWQFEKTFYPFEGWDNLLEKEFSFYDWSAFR